VSRSTFVLIPGAGSTSWYWHRVTPRLVEAGHDVVAVDLPVDDDGCGLADYAAKVFDAIGDRGQLVVVGQSMGAYTAPVVAARRPVELVVLVAPMVPAPGETPGEFWANTGQPDAARRLAIEEGRDPDASFDPVEMFLHDVAPDVVAASAEHVRNQSDRPFADVWLLDRWPDVPTRCVIGRQDRLFPAEFQRRVVADRLGLVVDEIDSGHLPGLSRPAELAQLLLRYEAEVVTGSRA
jgi:pimeloyl-ACP methyl ester carboxylesterase